MLIRSAIRDHIAALYGADRTEAICAQLDALLERYRSRLAGIDTVAGQSTPAAAVGVALTERDSILITYPDGVRAPDLPPLQSLARFCEERLQGLVSGIHLLPFYPSSSDDGFSVIDYRAVGPGLGDWDDVARLGKHFRLMFDAVLNHVSSSSQWFQGFLRGDPRYRHYFIVVPDGTDLSAAKLAGTGLRDADMIDATLTAADLTNADLRGARIKRTDMTRTKIDGLLADEALRAEIERFRRQ